ncbi:MAG: D-alanyl-D-alanine carboxypeptidase, partial [Pseudomonadota bacterium]
YDGPIEAPIALGQEIAELVIEAPGLQPVSKPLVAAAAVDEGGVLPRVTAALSLLLGAEEPSEASAE